MNVLRKLAYAPWYAAGEVLPMPIETDLAAALPAPDTTGWTIRWPRSYAWEHTWKRLEPIRAGLKKFVRIEPYDVGVPGWHEFGGFPLDEGDLDQVGTAGGPKSAHDLRGEIVKLPWGKRVYSFAIDFSDYPLVSSRIRDAVDLYFKFICPPDHHERVVPIGYFPSNPRMLAVARWLQRWHQPKRDIDVLARFGTWTDASSVRKEMVRRLERGGLKIRGGFGAMLPYPTYLQELRRSRICLDAPGQAPITPRLVEAMALGAVVVRLEVKIRMPDELVPGEHYVAYDGSDVVAVCKSLLDQFANRRLAYEAARYFERNFTAEAIARRMLQHMAGVVRE